MHTLLSVAQLADQRLPGGNWVHDLISLQRFHTSLNPVSCHALLKIPDIWQLLHTVYIFNFNMSGGKLTHSLFYLCFSISHLVSINVMLSYIWRFLITCFTIDSPPPAGKCLIPDFLPCKELPHIAAVLQPNHCLLQQLPLSTEHSIWDF